MKGHISPLFLQDFWENYSVQPKITCVVGLHRFGVRSYPPILCTKQSQLLASLQSHGAIAGISCSESKKLRAFRSQKAIVIASICQSRLQLQLISVTVRPALNGCAIVWGRGANRTRRNRRELRDFQCAQPRFLPRI